MEKNAATAHAEKCVKGATDLEKIDLAALTLDKTAFNATKSPLLRLPAEIRYEIWSFYISSLVINVDAMNRPYERYSSPSIWDPESESWLNFNEPRPPYYLTFGSCGRFTDPACRHIRPQYNAHSRPDHRCAYIRRIWHPLVCKQFWYETHEIFIGRATWVFYCHDDLLLFVKTKQHVLPYIRQLSIRDDHFTFDVPIWRWINSWHQALTWNQMRHFERLEGVELYASIPSWRMTWHILSDPRHDPLYCNKKLKAMLRSLQQHKLRPELTKVTITSTKLSKEQLKLWEVAWREVLLTHVPLGQGAGGKEKRWARKHLRDYNNMGDGDIN